MITKYWPWLIALLYFICPYDVLPDFAVGPGWLDDLVVLGLKIVCECLHPVAVAGAVADEDIVVRHGAVESLNEVHKKPFRRY